MIVGASSKAGSKGKGVVNSTGTSCHRPNVASKGSRKGAPHGRKHVLANGRCLAMFGKLAKRTVGAVSCIPTHNGLAS